MPFLCSSPTVLLSAVAQRTGRVRLLTGVTVLSIHDPVLVAEKSELLRQLWSQENVTWSGRYRDPIAGLTTQPRPYQPHIRVWHGSATSLQTTELAARFVDPLYSANGFFRTSQYQDLIDHYRGRWAHYGHPGAPLVDRVSRPC